MHWTKDFRLATFALLAADANGHPLYVPGGKLDTEMRSRCRAGAAIAIASLLFASVSRGQEISSASLSNETMIHHLEDLERQVRELRTEVATLKDQERDKDKTPTTLSRQSLQLRKTIS